MTSFYRLSILKQPILNVRSDDQSTTSSTTTSPSPSSYRHKPGSVDAVGRWRQTVRPRAAETTPHDFYRSSWPGRRATFSSAALVREIRVSLHSPLKAAPRTRDRQGGLLNNKAVSFVKSIGLLVSTSS